MPSAQIAPKMSYAKKYVEQVQDIAQAHQMSATQLALRYVLTRYNSVKCVIGAERASQVKEIAAMVGVLPPELMALIEQTFSNVEENVFNTLLWPR